MHFSRSSRITFLTPSSSRYDTKSILPFFITFLSCFFGDSTFRSLPIRKIDSSYTFLYLFLAHLLVRSALAVSSLFSSLSFIPSSSALTSHLVVLSSSFLFQLSSVHHDIFLLQQLRCKKNDFTYLVVCTRKL